MRQEPLDLRKSIAIIKRLKVIVGLVSALGLLVGAIYIALSPAGVSSTALVSLPSSAQSTATQVVIAGSDPVLLAASARLSPGVSVAQLRSEVQVTSPTGYLMSIRATAATTSESEAIANAVAESYIAYVGNQGSPVAHVVAKMFQPAIAATPSSRLKGMLIAGLVGAVVGAVVGCVVALAVGRQDRRLRDRDRIANSIGIPVLASVPVGHPANAADWTELLANYRPQAVHAWQLRTVLRYFGVAGQRDAPTSGDAADRIAASDEALSLAVVSLASDPGALALGPQLAAYAAAQGIPTALVIGQQQDAGATAALRIACAAPLLSSKLPSLLEVIVPAEQGFGQREGTALTVVVVVVDDRTPKMSAAVRTTAAVLGVSAGRATAEQLARAAVAAGADDREVAGILVADPEPTDKTTGRVPQLIRPSRRRQPSRLKGVVTESTR
jgi:capsular polysaccharide biosynthesis protein